MSQAVAAALAAPGSAGKLRELRSGASADTSPGRDGGLSARFSDVPQQRDSNVLTRQVDFSTRGGTSRTGADALSAHRGNATELTSEASPWSPDARPTTGQAFAPLFGSALAASASGDATAALNPVSVLAPSITAGAPGPATPATFFTGSIPVPVGSPQWAPAFSEQMVQIGSQQGGTLHHAELRLDPPDLGPLRISISMQGEQATATFVSPHASVRAAVEAALPELMQALADAGISLGDASVGEQDAREFAAEGSRNGAAREGDEADDRHAPVQAVVQARPRGLVDTFA